MRPCSASLAMARVPAKRWATREDLLRRIDAVRERIQLEPGRITLDEMAAAAAISSYHFHRLFTQTYGQTPQAFVQHCRLSKAHVLIATRTMGVHEACVEVGYASLATFSRQFKRKFGYPPSRTPLKWRLPEAMH